MGLVAIALLAAVILFAVFRPDLIYKLDDPEWRRSVHHWLQGWRIWHLVAVVVLAALVMAVVVAGPEGVWICVYLALLALLGVLLRLWRNEFLFLMSLRDDDLPGRHDKLVWAALLIALPPLGLWFFRSFRLAHWPEPVAKPAASGAAPEIA